MKKFYFILTALSLCYFGNAQGPAQEQIKVNPAKEMANTITAEELNAHLSILASDEFEGRETGTDGNKKAAQYIADEFKSFGIPQLNAKDGYYQAVAFSKVKWDKNTLSVNGNKYKHLWDYLSFTASNNDLSSFNTSEVVFLGYGIDDPKYSDYRKDVRGKVILIYNGEPTDMDGNSLLTGTKEKSGWTQDWSAKFKLAKEKGVKMVLVIDDNLKEQLNKNRRFFLNPRLSLGEPKATDAYSNNLFISSSIAKDILGKKMAKVIKVRDKIKAGKKSKAVKLKTAITTEMLKKAEVLRGDNVLGYIRGTDPALADELVVVSAHYDHLGKRGDDIYNGANDNGSGTSTVLEIAEAFAKAQQSGAGPRRSVLCLLVTGEEKGLLGSEYYSKNPVFPLEQTVADVNIDMVGRSDKKHAENPDYIYVIGSNMMSTELHRINEDMNAQHTDLELDYTYNAKDDPNRYYYRSDHYNFAKNGVPAIFYFNGTHRDYHRTSDTVEKINFESMEKVAKLAFHVTWELANRDKRIEVDVEQEEDPNPR